MKRWKLIGCLSMFIMIIAGIVRIIVFSQNNNDKTYSLTTLRTKSGYEFEIRAAKFVEISQSIYCKVMKNGEAIFPLKRIGGTVFDSLKLEFALIETEDKLVALIEKTAPHVVLDLYDLKNHTSWSTSDPKATWQEARAVRQEFLQRLKESIPGTPFVSSSGVGGDVELKVR